MRILLTNDDSHESPLLAAAMAAASKLGDVTVVVPAHEQSGTGKSVTIPRPLTLGEVEIEGVSCHTVDGTPADCVQVGIHHLMDERPDLVVSGINMGRNVGVPFLLWSGTVGACLEANLQEVPAIALSQDMEPSIWGEWITYRRLSPEVLSPLLEQTGALLERVFEALVPAACARTRPGTSTFPVQQRTPARSCSARLAFRATARAFRGTATTCASPCAMCARTSPRAPAVLC